MRVPWVPAFSRLLSGVLTRFFQWLHSPQSLIAKVQVWGLSGSFRKLGVPYFGVHIIRILLFRGTILGSPIFGKPP